MFVAPISQCPDRLDDVYELGRKNSSTLGFLPRGAYDVAYERDEIVVAISDGKVAGYLLYGTTKTDARVTHLCVKAPFRRRGIAQLLHAEAVKRTQHLQRIRLTCRKDYGASRLWRELGYRVVAQRDAKKPGHTLIHWELPYRQPPLLALIQSAGLRDRLEVVVDTNVLIDIANEDQDYPNSLALAADSLADEVALLVTPELSVELIRQAKSARATATQAFARSLPIVESDPVEVMALEAKLRAVMDAGRDENALSDRRHIAHCISAGKRIFVTRDVGIQRAADPLLREFDLRVLPPQDLILEHTDLVEHAASGVAVHLEIAVDSSPLSVDNRQQVVDSLVNTEAHERRNQWHKRVGELVATPTVHTEVVSDRKGQILGLAAFNIADRIYRLSEFRTKRKRNRLGILHLLLNRLIDQCSREQVRVIVLPFATAPWLANDIGSAVSLRCFGFVRTDESWLKLALPGRFSGQEWLSEAATSLPPQLAARLTDAVPESFVNLSESELRTSEAIAWPAKLTHLNQPCFTIPIRPTYARDLFPVGLPQLGLFARNDRLLWSPNNVYYRSARGARLPSAPFRALWYVSSESGQRVRALVGCSWIDSVDEGPARELHRRHHKLGVLSRADVNRMAGGGDSPASALHTVRFERFSNPISLDRYREIRTAYTDKGLLLQGPQRITGHLFSVIYDEGMRSRSGAQQ